MAAVSWDQEYTPEAEKKSLIEKVGGFMRELGRPAFTDAYARIDPKVANAFPLIEADKYRHYYKDYLHGTGGTARCVVCVRARVRACVHVCVRVCVCVCRVVIH